MTALRWALYLGVSWTWCIGMFLPVLLVRDYGFWAWVVFALPNVLGAAAMGFVIPDADASRRLVERNRGAMVLFSQVTIAFQAFFAAWMLPQLLGWWTLGFYPLMLTVMIFAVRGDKEFTLTSLMTFLFSAAMAVLLLTSGHLHLPESKGLAGASYLAPVCLLGFILCPYLDPTFHRAYQKAYDAGGPGGARGGTAARLAFLLGFVFVFGPMIVLSLAYSQTLTDLGARRLIGAHMLLQLAVTVVFHHVEVTRLTKEAPVKGFLKIGPLLALSTLLGLVCLFLPDILRWQAGEYVYRGFLSTYGLLFPVLALMQMIPQRPAPWNRVVTVLLFALPFYAAGFLTLQPMWLIPGVAVVAASPLIAKLSRA